MERYSERKPESAKKPEEVHFCLEAEGANVFFTVPLFHLSSPLTEGLIEVIFPVNADEKAVEEAKKILEETGCQECGIYAGYIKYNHLPPKWAVRVQVIRAFVPGDLASRTKLERELSDSGIACTSQEKMIFKTTRLKVYHPSEK